jgi:tRNA (uracil-5-)-methyltransferase TRM9
VFTPTVWRFNYTLKTAIRLVSPHGGKILIYVWAIEQDAQSKRVIPSKPFSDTQEDVKEPASTQEGVDVFVPWVHNTSASKEKPRVYHRYYHMFAEGELRQLVREAVEELGLELSELSVEHKGKGLTIVQEGWERSNYYIELLSWQNT